MWEIIVGGLIGVGGVIVGSVLNSRMSLGLEERRESMERKREERIIRRARRMLGDELETLAGHLMLIVEAGAVPSATLMQSDRFLPLGDWRRNRELLAEMLEDQEWERLPVLFHNVETFRFRLAHDRPGDPLDEETSRRIIEMSAEAAYVAQTLLGNSEIPDPKVHPVFESPFDPA